MSSRKQTKMKCKGEVEQAAPHKVRACSASGMSLASLAGRAWEATRSPPGSPIFPVYAMVTTISYLCHTVALRSKWDGMYDGPGTGPGQRKHAKT